eukprot:121065-Pelagomonas_calceolata.AAC.1
MPGCLALRTGLLLMLVFHQRASGMPRAKPVSQLSCFHSGGLLHTISACLITAHEQVQAFFHLCMLSVMPEVGDEGLKEGASGRTWHFLCLASNGSPGHSPGPSIALEFEKCYSRPLLLFAKT